MDRSYSFNKKWAVKLCISKPVSETNANFQVSLKSNFFMLAVVLDYLAWII
jgi:hypothetical protein